MNWKSAWTTERQFLKEWSASLSDSLPTSRWLTVGITGVDTPALRSARVLTCTLPSELRVLLQGTLLSKLPWVQSSGLG